jgi:hypothetical protein
MGYWVIFSKSWQLEDLQAGLSIVIQIICVSGIFIASQYFWQRHALQVARGQRVPIARVLSIHGPGEVWDALLLLRGRVWRYKSTAVQCAIVLLLGVTTLFSGPIARFASRNGVSLPERGVEGLLASRTSTCIRDDVVGVQRVWDRLDKARFPKDQLLDWLPDVGVDWEYVDGDWNSTWRAGCEFVNKTEVLLTGTGVSNGTDDRPRLFHQFEGLTGLVENFRSNWSYITTDNQGTIRNNSFADATLWLNVVDFDPMRMALVIVYMDAPPSREADDGVEFGVGPAPATYVKAECTLRNTSETLFRAYPDLTMDDSCVVENFKQHFFQGVLARDRDGVGGHLPRAEDVWRWFQSYMVRKDVKRMMPVERELSVRVRNVEVAGWWLGIASVLVLAVLVGFARYCWVLWKYGAVVKRVPETKADWVLHAVGGKGLDESFGVGTWLETQGKRGKRYRRMGSSSDLEGLRPSPYTRVDSESGDSVTLGSVNVGKVQYSRLDDGIGQVGGSRW